MAGGRTASMEDYLEAIAVLGEERQVVRVSHISRMLDVSMPSVSSALKKLAEEGLVDHERYGYVQLTDEGDRIARDVLHRHEALSRFLTDILGVDASIAREDACKMEHSVSPSTRDRLSKFVAFVLRSAGGRLAWLEKFNYYFENAKRREGGRTPT